MNYLLKGYAEGRTKFKCTLNTRNDVFYQP